MRRLIGTTLVIFLTPCWCLGANSSVTVRQLDGILAEARAKASSDRRTANAIAHLDLTERLTRATQSRLSSGLGPGAVAALELLADRSAFLDPSADEIPPGELPSPAERQAILERATAYVLAYVKSLPNMVCTRVVSRFEDLDARDRGRLDPLDTLTGELTMRDGKESFHALTGGAKDPLIRRRSPQDLTTSGEYGSILSEPFVRHGAFTWRRWETMDGQRVAVVGYSVPRTDSLFTVSWCCETATPGVPGFSQNAAYEGEMAIDPASGAVLRVAQQAVGLSAGFPVKRTWTAVEYMPVTLGGGSFLVPARSVTFMEALRRSGRFEHYLNRSEFRNYHKFEAESTVAFEAPPETPPASMEGAPAAAAAAVVASAALPEPPPVPPAPSAAASGVTPPAAPSPVKEETPPAANELVFRVHSEEIPVRAVVRDERGNAVGDLRPEDFELFDNGKLEQLTGFRVERRGEENPPSGKAGHGTQGGAAPRTQPAPMPRRYVMFLFDDLDLTFEQLMSTHAATKRAIGNALEPGTRVALLTESGKQHVDFTDDPAKLGDALDRVAPQTSPPGYPEDSRSSPFAKRTLLGPPGTDSAAAAPQPGPYEHTDFHKLVKVIEAAVRRLAMMPGERSIVFVSPGFRIPEGDRRDYWKLIDGAARRGIPINTLDVRGVWVAPGFDAGQEKIENPDYADLNGQFSQQLDHGFNLRGLADGTGGIAVRSTNDFDDGFGRIATRPEFTYMLAFSPPDLVPDGKYHKLKVEVRNRRGVTVQARDGYLAPDGKLTEAERAAREIEDAVFSRDESREIPVTVGGACPAKPAKVCVSMRIGLGAVRFSTEGGRSRASLTATVGLFDSNGIYIDGKRDKLDLDYAGGKVPASVQVRGGFNAAPGTCFVRVVVRDQDGHMSSINRTVEVR